MTKLYLITGFLGAGKTTFLHQFVRLFPDRRTAIVVNEFGKQGVDGPPSVRSSGSGINSPIWNTRERSALWTVHGL